MAVVDPELTYDLPPDITAATGLDALTQLIEPFVSNSANPLTDGLCREGIPRIARTIRAATDGEQSARSDMALGSLFGGLALANAKLGAVHGFAGPLGGMYPGAPHGIICGKLLPIVMRTNYEAANRSKNHATTRTRFDEIGRLLTGKTTAGAEDGLLWIEELCADFGLPGLGMFGVAEEDFGTIIEASKRASSMKGNPITLNDEQLASILAEGMR
jgi:alcohol dehydrogenase class IV